MKKLVLSPLVLAAASFSAFAGPYSDGNTGTSASSTAVVEWANQVVNLTRGPADIQDPTGATATFGVAANALGPSDALQNSGNVVSLGDGGSITLSFAQPIGNGPGADLSVFENGFATTGGQGFLELGFVSVSTDGTHFFTFPSVSLTQTTTQVGAFGTLDPTNISGLAGKTFAGIGTNFDLQQLAGVSPYLNINDVQYVKVTDVVGDINPAYATYDSLGNIINDPYPTAFASGGFDLDAVAVLNVGAAPEPSTWALAAVALVFFAILRKRFRGRASILGLVAAALTTGFAQADNIDFSGLTPSTPYTEPGATVPSGAYTNDQAFTVQGVNFNNLSGHYSWSGFAYSKATNVGTSGADYEYQYSAAGTGIPTFALGFVDAYTPFNPTITLPTGYQPLSLTVTNDVYSELSMENGDGFARQFSYADHDYFLLTINGLNSLGASTGTVDFYLADFRTPTSPGIVTDWTNVNLSSLGAGTDQLVFTESSSDSDPVYGMNTPAYFALGGLTVAETPEPSVYLLLLVGFGLLAFYKRTRV